MLLQENDTKKKEIMKFVRNITLTSRVPIHLNLVGLCMNQYNVEFYSHKYTMNNFLVFYLK